MLRRNTNHTRRVGQSRTKLRKPEESNLFYFTMSEKGHEIVLPVEQETTWEQLHDIIWDPGRGD